MSVRIPVGRNGEVLAHALVDEADRPLVAGWWTLNREGYAVARRNGRTTSMNRLILGLTPGDGLRADHINGDRLDNRRSNLRAVTHRENIQNRRPRRFGTSRFRGVHWCDTRKRWVAKANIDGRQHWIGVYEDETLAGLAAAEYRAIHMPAAIEHDAAAA